jgi:hypothetical protein
MATQSIEVFQTDSFMLSLIKKFINEFIKTQSEQIYRKAVQETLWSVFIFRLVS